MRYSIIVVFLVLALPAIAQDGKWTAAPVPSLDDGHIQPSARAGQPVGEDGSTPFSSAPSGSIERNGATSADTYNGVQTPDLSK